MTHTKDELGTFRRVWLMLFGLYLLMWFRDPWPVRWIIGVFSLVILLAASGLIELAMALYYRRKRRAARHA